MTEQLPPLPEPVWKPQHFPHTGAAAAFVPPVPQTVQMTGYSLPIGGPLFTADQLRSYAEQVRAAEREACAQIAEQMHDEYEIGDYDGTDIASAIRGRG